MGIGGGAHAGPLSRRERQVRRNWRYVLVIGGPAILLAGALIIRTHQAGRVGRYLLLVAVVMVLLICHGYAVERAAKRASPRPRGQYFLFVLGYVALFGASTAVGIGAEVHHIAWLSQAMEIPLGVATAGALLMFGRGAFHGRLRRRFWRVPPPWLDQDGPSGTASTGD
jgi:hypothetical protein